MVHSEVTLQSGTNRAAVLRRARVINWPYWLRRNTGDHTRLMRGMQARARLPGRTADRNGMKHAGLMNGADGKTIVLWRTKDIDGKHCARAPSETQSCAPAAGSRRPSPAKGGPVRPVATAERRPTPRVTRCPDISGAGIGYPAAISVRIEVSILCNGRLPHLALTLNVIPASVGVEIGPAIALITREGFARSRSV
jgi:hypothetical protein